MSRLTIYLMLALAIAVEVVSTTALARSQGMTKLGPTALALAGYVVAFWLLSQALRVLPTGIVYGIWSGLGLVLIAGVAWLGYGQRLDAPAILGLGLIVAGVLVVHLFSATVGH
jgi:small multidrug resistance pump